MPELGRLQRILGPQRTRQLKKELNGRRGELVRVPLPIEEQAGFDVLLSDFLPIEVANLYRSLRPKGLVDGDAVFFVMGIPKDIYKFAGIARTKIGEDLNLINKDRFEFCWIVNFPMYEWNEEEKKIDFSHNPFSMPQMPADAFLNIDLTDHDQNSLHNCEPIRHRLQRRRIVLRRDPQSPSRRHEEGVCHRRL